MALSEAEVKLGFPAAKFYPGQTLEVVSRNRYTIVVSYFDGREQRTAWLEVVPQDEENQSE